MGSPGQVDVIPSQAPRTFLDLLLLLLRWDQLTASSRLEPRFEIPCNSQISSPFRVFPSPSASFRGRFDGVTRFPLKRKQHQEEEEVSKVCFVVIGPSHASSSSSAQSPSSLFTPPALNSDNLVVITVSFFSRGEPPFFLACMRLGKSLCVCSASSFLRLLPSLSVPAFNLLLHFIIFLFLLLFHLQCLDDFPSHKRLLSLLVNVLRLFFFGVSSL